MQQPVTTSNNQWIRFVDNEAMIGSSRYAEPIRRYSIADLIQRDYCTYSTNYSVDRPSTLVRIECRKPGCRCVLKSEPALACKIVSGVTIVQARWISSQRQQPTAVNPSSNRRVILTSSSPAWFELLRTNDHPSTFPGVPVWTDTVSLCRSNPSLILLRRDAACIYSPSSSSSPASCSSDILIDQSSILELPTTPNRIKNRSRQQQTPVQLDPANIVVLPEGTVLRVIGSRLCRVKSSPSTTPNNSSLMTSCYQQPWSVSSSHQHRGRHTSPSTVAYKTSALLQCSIIGAKALHDVALIAASSTNSGHFAFNYMSSSDDQCNSLVYLPIDSINPVYCSPVYSSSLLAPPSNGRRRARSTAAISSASYLSSPPYLAQRSPQPPGLYNALTLLGQHRLPLLVRPVTGRVESANWLNSSGPDLASSSSPNDVLKLESSHHGDLIFLEPLSSGSQSTTSSTGRFFVVTPDMLQQHCFIPVTTTSPLSPNDRYQIDQLESHAHRVANFLTSVHPADGLSYLVKHLEDVTCIGNTGPSHLPVTRTLGPISRLVEYTILQSSLASCVASAVIASGGDLDDEFSDEDESVTNHRSATNGGGGSLLSLQPSGHYRGRQLQSVNDGSLSAYPSSNLSSCLLASEADHMNALGDELDEIYYYVRNGRLPNESQSMTSLLVGRTPPHRSPLTPHRHLQPAMNDGRVKQRFGQSQQQFNDLLTNSVSSRLKLIPGQSTTGLYNHGDHGRYQQHHSVLDLTQATTPQSQTKNNDGRRKSKVNLLLNRLLMQQQNSQSRDNNTASSVSTSTTTTVNNCNSGQYKFTNSRILEMRPPPPPLSQPNGNNHPSNEGQVMQLVTCFDSACQMVTSSSASTNGPMLPSRSTTRPAWMIGRRHAPGNAASSNVMTQSTNSYYYYQQSTPSINRPVKQSVSNSSAFVSHHQPPPQPIIAQSRSASRFNNLLGRRPAVGGGTHDMTNSLLLLPPIQTSDRPQERLTSSSLSNSSPLVKVNNGSSCRRLINGSSNNSSPDTGIALDQSSSLEFGGGNLRPCGITASSSLLLRSRH